MKMKHAIAALLSGVLMILSAKADDKVQPKPGPAGSWRLIGTTHADYKGDHDQLIIKGPYDNFRALRFRVSNAVLYLNRILVTYENGEADRIDVHANIPQGGESSPIDLHGAGTRKLAKIEYWYRTQTKGNGQAELTIYGMK